MKFDQMSGRVAPIPEYGSRAADNRTFRKQTLLLSTAIFLMTAPAPDSQDIAELTANFIVSMDDSDPSPAETGD